MSSIVDIFAIIPTVADNGPTIVNVLTGEVTGSVGGPGIAGGNIVAAFFSPFVNPMVNGQLQGFLAGFTIVKIAAELNNGVAPSDIGLGDAIQIVAGGVTVAAAVVAVTTGSAAVTMPISILGIFAAAAQYAANQNGYTVGSLASIISSILGTTPDPLVKKIIYVDPLILDLDGDGLEITPLSKGILFDANGDTIKTGTAWAASDDGMLVWDRNANGQIDSGTELFGDETILANGQKATNGFTALAELDSNADSKFDALDAQYANLRVWRDLNQDGVSQADELQGLNASGVQSINLSSTAGSSNYDDAILGIYGDAKTTFLKPWGNYLPRNKDSGLNVFKTNCQVYAANDAIWRSAA